jgi:hypothetical protein
MHKLDALDIKALRTADSLVFRTRDEESHINCCKKIQGNPWETERQHCIPVRAYGAKEAFESWHYANNDLRWKTIVRSLCVGDMLRLHWYADAAQNQNLCAARADGSCEGIRYTVLHGDILYLQVDREGKDGAHVRYAEHFIHLSICPYNSARMIRR